MSTWFLCIPIGWLGRRWQPVNQCVTIKRPLGVKVLLEACRAVNVRAIQWRVDWSKEWPRPPLCLAVGVRNVLESHLAGVDRKFASIPFGAHRVDFPTVVQRNKGNASDQEAQLASAACRAEALTAYEHDKHAVSAHASRGSLFGTWTGFLRAWLGPTASITPVAPEHTAFVGEAMKMRGYHSFSNYLSRAQEAHVAAGIPGSHGTNWKQHKVHVPSHEVRGRPDIQPRCLMRAWLGWIWGSKHYARLFGEPRRCSSVGRRSCFVKLSWQQRDCRMCTWYQCLSVLFEASDQ